MNYLTNYYSGNNNRSLTWDNGKHYIIVSVVLQLTDNNHVFCTSINSSKYKSSIDLTSCIQSLFVFISQRATPFVYSNTLQRIAFKKSKQYKHLTTKQHRLIRTCRTKIKTNRKLRIQGAKELNSTLFNYKTFTYFLLIFRPIQGKHIALEV